MPVTVVHGDEDPLFPLGNGEALAREIPEATLHVIPGMGHELSKRVRPAIAAVIIDTVRRAARPLGSAPIDDIIDKHFGGYHLQTLPFTEVRPSEIHGRGLFATAYLATGTLLGVLDGQRR